MVVCVVWRCEQSGISGGRVDRSNRYELRAPKKFPPEGRSVGSFQPPKNLRPSGGEGRSVGFSDPKIFSALRAGGRSVGSFRPEIFPRPLGSGSVGRVFRPKNFRRPPGGRVGRSGPAESEMAKFSKVGRSVECGKPVYYFALPGAGWTYFLRFKIARHYRRVTEHFNDHL